jgi:hypothetical protein
MSVLVGGRTTEKLSVVFFMYSYFHTRISACKREEKILYRERGSENRLKTYLRT